MIDAFDGVVSKRNDLQIDREERRFASATIRTSESECSLNVDYNRDCCDCMAR